MGYKIALDALLYLLVSFHFNKRALEELKATGDFTGLSPEECVTARHDIESLVGLDEFYGARCSAALHRGPQWPRNRTSATDYLDPQADVDRIGLCRPIPALR